MKPYQQYIAKSRYARYLPDEKRRENWPETVGRWLQFFEDKIPQAVAGELRDAMTSLSVLPSMRSVMTAGPALEKSHVAGYNCAYIAIDHPRAFDELMFILMNGTGVGFSVERDNTNKLPEVSESFHTTETIITVADSKIGWAKAFKELIALLYSGQIPSWDTAKVRAAGEPLRTFGGRASGPEPLEALFSFTVETFKGARGRKLTTLECHDLCCKVADIVVVGGVRRSALISLSNLSDDRLRRCKSGQWFEENPQRGLANNSVAYTVKPDFDSFLTEWQSLYESKSGERGFFSREACDKQAIKNGRREGGHIWGTNPCSEIILRPNQFCNLSEVVIRPNDTFDTLSEKVVLATIMGTLQATLTDFKYLRPIWQRNTEEEALLGVSFTGIMDHAFMSGVQKTSKAFNNLSLGEALEEFRALAVQTNKFWAKKLGINQAAAITCVKPSGTVSQLVDSASGIHARFSPFYNRRVRADIKDPLCQVMIDAGVPYEPARGNPSVLVFSTAQKAPKGALLGDEHLGIPQLELWSTYQKHWCEQKPSITVTYRDSDFLAIGQWLYDNFDEVSGVSFLPEFHNYEQPPYEAISEAEYNKLEALMPKHINWDIEENMDMTEGAQTLACVGLTCEI